MLRLRGGLQEPWMEDIPDIRRCVVGVRVTFVELRRIAAKLVSVWDTVREYVRYTGRRHFNRSFDKIGKVLASCVLVYLDRYFCVFVGELLCYLVYDLEWMLRSLRVQKTEMAGATKVSTRTVRFASFSFAFSLVVRDCQAFPMLTVGKRT